MAKTKESSQEVSEGTEKRREFVDNPVIQKIQKRIDKFAGVIPELTQQYREFTVGSVPNDRVIRVYFPTPKDDSDIALIQSRRWGKLVKEEDLQTENEIIEIMKKRGLWSDLNEKKMKSLQEKHTRLSGKITKMIIDKDVTVDFEKLTEEYEDTERELYDLIDKRSTFTAHSLENRVSETVMKERMWRCIRQVNKKENDEVELVPIWNSYEEIENERDRVLVMSVQTECMTFWQGVPADFLDDLLGVKNGETDTQS